MILHVQSGSDSLGMWLTFRKVSCPHSVGNGRLSQGTASETHLDGLEFSLGTGG